MGLFNAIMDKILHHPAAGAAPEAAAPPPPPAPAPQPAVEASAASPVSPAAAPAAAPAAQPVDVEAVLSTMAQDKGGGGDWRSSIVDLLKLLDLDSSLSARKQLAEELDCHEGADGSAEENMALHKAVMQKLKENGGKAPASLKA